MGYGNLSRQEIIEALTKRDGYQCFFPGCDVVFGDKDQPTIDHWISQDYGKKNGWTSEQIHDLNNLRLLCRKDNIRKSNITPNPDGSITLPPPRPPHAKVQKVAVCDYCYSGRLLLAFEICDYCGTDPQPKTAPLYLQSSVKDCDHDHHFCSYCFTGLIPRKSPLESLLRS